MRIHCLIPLSLFLAPQLAGQRVPEVEPNDTAATAQIVVMGSQVDAWLTIGDVDWYRFTSTGGNVRMVTNSTLNTRLELWDGSATTQLAFSDDARGAQSDLTINLAAGSYCCRIQAASPSAGAYSLDLGEIAYKPFTGVEVEPNNSRATAQRIFNGAKINASLSANQFVPVITASTSVEVISVARYQLNTGSWLKTPQAGNILTIRGFANPANNGLRQIFAATANTITVNATAPYGPLVVEPAGASVTIDAGDEDWYQIVLPTQSAIWLNVSEGENSCIPRSRYEFCDAQGLPVAATLGTPSGDGSFLNFRQSQIRVWPAGTYYVVIKQSNQINVTNTTMSPFANYRLELLMQPMQTAGMALELPEPNQSIATASPLIPGQTGIGRITPVNGLDASDWWGPFLLAGPSVVTWQTTLGTPSPLMDSTINVRDGYGAILLTTLTGNSLSNENHARATVTFNLPITFYLEVLSPGIQGFQSGDYLLEVSSIDPIPDVSAEYTIYAGNTTCGPAPRPLLAAQFANERPVLGTTFSRLLNQAPGSAPFLWMQGLTNLSANGAAVGLPYDLSLFGATGCTVNVDPLSTVLRVAGPSGSTSLDQVLPGALVLRGMWVFEQCAVLVPSANALGLQMTNHARLTIGERSY